MKQFFVLRSSFLVCGWQFVVRSWLLALVGFLFVHAPALSEEPGTKNQEQRTEVFRPEPGKFPPLEKAHAYRGELVFVDHANRRGSIRVAGTGKFYRNDPQPFAMLPYGVIRYQGAPADLRDIPLGTVMHVRAFLPPDPKLSAVPVLPVDNKEKDAGHYRGTGTAPAENHVLLLEDEPSHCLYAGKVWKLKEVELKNNAGKIVASREPKDGGDGNFEEEELTFDAATRIWRGRERIRVADLVAEEAWPASGKKQLGGQAVLLGITWKPAPGDGLSGAFTQFHISDIWLDDEAIQHAAQFQTETHKSFVRSRWMPAWIDAVEYGKFGRATVTATLFGGMDDSLYNDFRTRLPIPSTPAANYWTVAASETFTNSKPYWRAIPANWPAIFCTSSRFMQPELRSGSRIVRRSSQCSMHASQTVIECAISFTHSCRAGFFSERMVADDTSHTHSSSFSSRSRSRACVAFAGECAPGAG